MIRPPDTFYQTWAQFHNVMPPELSLRSPSPIVIHDSDSQPPSDSEDEQMPQEWPNIPFGD